MVIAHVFFIKDFGGPEGLVNAGIKGFKQDVGEYGHCFFEK